MDSRDGSFLFSFSTNCDVISRAERTATKNERPERVIVSNYDSQVSRIAYERIQHKDREEEKERDVRHEREMVRVQRPRL